MAAYSAFLISSLAVQHQHLPFRDLQGLLHDGSYRLGVLKNSYEINMFEVSGWKYLWPDYIVLVGLGFLEKLLGIKHSVSLVFHLVIMSKQNEVLSLSKKNNFETYNRTLAALRTFYELSYRNNCSHVQWYQARLTSNLVTTVTTCNGIPQCSQKQLFLSDICTYF